MRRAHVTKRPDVHFFVIGAARSGTTSLFRHLVARADVHRPRSKEPRFFSSYWARGWSWYCEQIGPAVPGAMVGDFSPNYSNCTASNPAARRIAESYPEARILYLVRNPIACAISNWRMVAELTGTQPDFGTAMRGDWAVQVLYRSLFFHQISQYRRVLPDSQILVVPLEAVRANPSYWLRRIEGHLGLEPSGASEFPRANASFRKANRPAAPRVARETREIFCRRVAEDARNLLRYAGQPEDLWSIGAGASAWEPVR